MRIGVIGLGDIAKKAYLPVTTRLKHVELYLVSRNKETLNDLKSEYKHLHICTSYQDLIDLKVDLVMIHAKTEVHPELCKLFLKKKIPVFVDKPVSMEIEEVREVFQLAKEMDTFFRVGFNRRFVPSYREIKSNGTPDVILYQKNRFHRVTNLKRFIFDDFIHVADTILYFMNEPINEVIASNKVNESGMGSLHVHFVGNSVSATAVMHRNSGLTEERLEVIYPEKKYLVDNLSDLIIHEQDQTMKSATKDWEPTLTTRGFQGMIEQLILDVSNDRSYQEYDDLALASHELCETIYQALNKE